MGTTVGIVLLSYDISANHLVVKSQMKLLGYYENWKMGSQGTITYDLPNTTLWHNLKSSDQAMEDIKNVCSKCGTKLEKAVAVNAKEFVGFI